MFIIDNQNFQWNGFLCKLPFTQDCEMSQSLCFGERNLRTIPTLGFEEQQWNGLNPRLSPCCLEVSTTDLQPHGTAEFIMPVALYKDEAQVIREHLPSWASPRPQLPCRHVVLNSEMRRDSPIPKDIFVSFGHLWYVFALSILVCTSYSGCNRIMGKITQVILISLKTFSALTLYIYLCFKVNSRPSLWGLILKVLFFAIYCGYIQMFYKRYPPDKRAYYFFEVFF